MTGGATDSGIHDESLRERLCDHLKGLSADDYRVLTGRVVRELCLTDEQLAAGYGIEDAEELIGWIGELAWR